MKARDQDLIEKHSKSKGSRPDRETEMRYTKGPKRAFTSSGEAAVPPELVKMVLDGV